jgi:hypothetical protein
LARIECLSISNNLTGAMTIISEVNIDFWEVILYTVCLVFKHNEEVVERKIRGTFAHMSFMDDPKYNNNVYIMGSIVF